MMRLYRNGPHRFAVPDHEVGIGADGDCPFARIDIEDLRSVGGREPDKLVRCQPSTPDAMLPQHAHPVFDAAGPVRNAAEIIPTRRLLWRAETTVVGRGGLQGARGKSRP